ncbi:hypothetical protein HPB50_006807 [Hyalomma asiaticum]|uniref:Uncharacterized protein n=1 Tax=Hyalomma asiaticum TaxID=266040 RepID=A0ACB7RYW8_HYAAI|nr:hypothetical protein HPB50_006807 [Hyalomma asiaticum]
MCDLSVVGSHSESATTPLQLSAVTGQRLIYLGTAIVHASSGHTSALTHLIFDGGNQRRFLTTRLGKKLKCKPTRHENLSHGSFGGHNTKSYRTVTLQICDTNEASWCIIDTLVIEKTCDQLVLVIQSSTLQEKANAGLIIAGLNSPTSQAHETSQAHDIRPVEFLIGPDHYWELVNGETHSMKQGLRVVQTVFDWTLLGPETTNSTTSLCVKQGYSTYRLDVFGKRRSKFGLSIS